MTLFPDPAQQNEVTPDPLTLPARAREFRAFSAHWVGLTFAGSFSCWAQYSNLFALLAGQYHQVASQSQVSGLLHQFTCHSIAYCTGCIAFMPHL